MDRLSAERTPDTAPVDPVERQHHLRALALAALVDDATGTGRSGRAEFVAVIDADAAGPAPMVEWPIPVEVPARVLADLAGTADITGPPSRRQPAA